ncbi:hypothetical protein K437DRAFT_267545 [Tilletiaria anomala UBC 951]|uniref:Uncharacterized protein n=1 Tax=Tilletiaria anomala (strain ATCC 24038 / CBS 436.72 / UBC 951) TaxID=1037660 RepID=A0A066W5A0_TILAU|nr:uncharacterized protein K437DRAFT_267545 [Tilletiaria anomala UBC 951]KDN48886.1 hypothetical protein K437DRAFT_267545 [Tilletiaria anomala UBC 951]
MQLYATPPPGYQQYEPSTVTPSPADSPSSGSTPRATRRLSIASPNGEAASPTRGNAEGNSGAAATVAPALLARLVARTLNVGASLTQPRGVPLEPFAVGSTNTVTRYSAAASPSTPSISSSSSPSPMQTNPAPNSSGSISNRPSRVRFPISAARGFSSRDAATSAIPSAWPPSYNLDAHDAMPYLPARLRLKSTQLLALSPPAQSALLLQAQAEAQAQAQADARAPLRFLGSTTGVYELNVKFWLTPIWKFQFPCATYTDPAGEMLFEFNFKRMAGAGSLSWEMRDGHAQGRPIMRYESKRKRERLVMLGGTNGQEPTHVTIRVGRVGAPKGHVKGASTRLKKSLKDRSSGTKYANPTPLDQATSANVLALHRSLSNASMASNATAVQLMEQTQQLLNIYPIRHTSLLESETRRWRQKGRDATSKSHGTKSTSKTRPSVLGRRVPSFGSSGSASQVQDLVYDAATVTRVHGPHAGRAALPMEEQEWDLDERLAGGAEDDARSVASETSSSWSSSSPNNSINQNASTLFTSELAAANKKTVAATQDFGYDYCEFSIPHCAYARKGDAAVAPSGRWTWVTNRPMRSIDGLRFDTIKFALIEHRQPATSDVVIATFSMIDELSEPNWKLCIRTGVASEPPQPSTSASTSSIPARSPLADNPPLIMATLMILYRSAWTRMSAEAQSAENRARNAVKRSLEAASLSHSGYVNYQLGRSGEVKEHLISGLRRAADRAGNGAARPARAVSGVRDTQAGPGGRAAAAGDADGDEELARTRKSAAWAEPRPPSYTPARPLMAATC